MDIFARANNTLSYVGARLLLNRFTRDEIATPTPAEIDAIKRMVNRDEQTAYEAVNYAISNLEENSYGCGVHYRSLKIIKIILDSPSKSIRSTALAARSVLRKCQTYTGQLEGTGNVNLNLIKERIRNDALSALQIMYKETEKQKTETGGERYDSVVVPIGTLGGYVGCSQVYDETSAAAAMNSCSAEPLSSKDMTAHDAEVALKVVSGRWGPQQQYSEPMNHSSREPHRSNFLESVNGNVTSGENGMIKLEEDHKPSIAVPSRFGLHNPRGLPRYSLNALSNSSPAARLVEAQPIDENMIRQFAKRGLKLCSSVGIKPSVPVEELRVLWRSALDIRVKRAGLQSIVKQLAADSAIQCSRVCSLILYFIREDSKIIEDMQIQDINKLLGTLETWKSEQAGAADKLSSVMNEITNLIPGTATICSASTSKKESLSTDLLGDLTTPGGAEEFLTEEPLAKPCNDSPTSVEMTQGENHTATKPVFDMLDIGKDTSDRNKQKRGSTDQNDISLLD